MPMAMQRLIASLKGLPNVEDHYLSKRIEPRYALRAKATLDVQRSNGEEFSVSALDVSDSGVGFLCRRAMEPQERIGLRLAYHDEQEYEPFEVRRGTPTVGGYKIGAVVNE